MLILSSGVDALALGTDEVDAVYHGPTRVWPADAPSPSIETILGRVVHLRAKDTTGSEAADVTAWSDARTSSPYIFTNGYPSARPTLTPNGKRAVRFSGSLIYPSVANLMFDGANVASLTASSQFNPGYPPSSVAGRDGDWATSGFNSPEWFRVQLTTPVVVTSYSLRAASSGGRYPLNWNFRGSQDGVTWITLDAQAGAPPSGLQTYNFTNSTAYLYYELQFTAINGGDLLYMARIDIPGLNFTGTPVANAEAFLVLKSNYAGGGHPIDMSGTDTRYPYSDNWIYTAFGGGRSAYPAPVDLSQWRTYRMRYNAGTHTEWLDGSQSLNATSVGGPAWHSVFRIGTGGSVPSHVDIAEILVYNRNLTDEEVTIVYDYLTAEHFT